MFGKSRDYVDEILIDKINVVRKHAAEGRLVDLCCGTGEVLFSLRDVSMDRVGIDFSYPFISRAMTDERTRSKDITFLVGDARKLPFQDMSVATLYCFSSLYAISNMHEAVSEISRVLRPGGRCILDMGNSRSLNDICVRAYPELPPTFRVPVSEMRSIIAGNALKIQDHRSFQILPLWASKPRWLAPLLHPGWKNVMKRRIAGRMLDEWISSAPFIRTLAFRHIFVCEK